jgi:hypothetical protein
MCLENSYLFQPPSSCARDKLRQVRQGTNESVNSYIKRFRQQLNELTYAMQHETKDSVKRAVTLYLETESAIEQSVLKLRPEIEARVAAKDPTNFQEAQEAAFKAIVRFCEIERTKNMQRIHTFPN